MKQALILLIFLSNSFFTLAYGVENVELLMPIQASGNDLLKGEVPGIMDEVDSLTFVNTKRNERVVVSQGMNVVVLTHDKQKISGEFSRITGENIEVKVAGKPTKLATANIKQVTVFYYPTNAIHSTLRSVHIMTGAASLTLGGAALIGGIATLESSVVLGVGLVGIGVPLIYYGLKRFIKLRRLSRRKIRLGRRWKISIQESN